jgi:hypothetical protein
MNIKVYGDLYKDHVGFLQILQGVLDSIYTDYYFDFKDNSGYDIFKVRFSYHIITHTEQVILNKEFIRERSMSNSSWMRMKYGLLKSFTADLFKILMFNNDILGNPVGDLSDIINSIRENPNLIQEGFGKEYTLTPDQAYDVDKNLAYSDEPVENKTIDLGNVRIDSDVFPDRMFKGAEMNFNPGPSNVYIEYSVDGKEWHKAMRAEDRFMRMSFDGKSWTYKRNLDNFDVWYKGIKNSKTVSFDSTKTKDQIKRNWLIEKEKELKNDFLQETANSYFDADPKLTDLEEKIIQKKATDFVKKNKKEEEKFNSSLSDEQIKELKTSKINFPEWVRSPSIRSYIYTYCQSKGITEADIEIKYFCEERKNGFQFKIINPDGSYKWSDFVSYSELLKFRNG